MTSTVSATRLAGAALVAALFLPAAAAANDSNDQRLRRQYGDAYSYSYGWGGPGYGYPDYRVYRPYRPGVYAPGYRYGYPAPGFVPPYRPYGGGPYGYPVPY